MSARQPTTSTLVGLLPSITHAKSLLLNSSSIVCLIVCGFDVKESVEVAFAIIVRRFGYPTYNTSDSIKKWRKRKYNVN
jgi:hypothetical protein